MLRLPPKISSNDARNGVQHVAYAPSFTLVGQNQTLLGQTRLFFVRSQPSSNIASPTESCPLTEALHDHQLTNFVWKRR